MEGKGEGGQQARLPNVSLGTPSHCPDISKWAMSSLRSQKQGGVGSMHDDSWEMAGKGQRKL